MKKYLIAIIAFFILYLFTIFLNNYPTFYAAKKIPSGFIYSGHASWFDPWDLNVYLSSIRYGQKHGLLLKNLYTTNDKTPIIMYPAYTILGMLFPNSSIFHLYYFFQFITIFIIIVSLIYSSFVFLKDIKLSFITILLVTISRGYGWLFINTFKSPDLFVTGFAFRSSFQRPHEGIGMVLYILAFTFLYSFLITNRGKYFILSFFCNIIQIFFYPYYYVNYLLIFSIFILFTNKSTNKIMSLTMSGTVLAILSFIYYISIYNSGFASDLAEQQPTISPLGLLSGYGIYLPIFLFCFFSLKNKIENRPLIFLCLWVFISLLLSYFPLGFSRFYLRGLYFPLIIITLITIKNFIQQKKITVPILGFFAGLYIISIIPSTLYIFYKRLNEANLTNNINGWYYLPKDYFDAFKFLDKLPNDGVLSDYWIGNHIPVFTNKSVYLGHLIQTPNAKERTKQIQEFFSNQYSPTQAKTFLTENHINYIFYGLQERQYGKINYDFIKSIYTKKDVTILKVLK